MVVRLIIHFHGPSPIQSVQNWKLVVLNCLTCSIWSCQENQWDTREYSPVYTAIFKVRPSSIFMVSSYGENGWIFNTWEHLGIIKCTWPSKFWSYILPLTHNGKSIFLIRYMDLLERLSVERTLESKGREWLLNGKIYSMPLCLPRSSRQLEGIASGDFLVLLMVSSLMSKMGNFQPRVTCASVGSGCFYIRETWKEHWSGEWKQTGSSPESQLLTSCVALGHEFISGGPQCFSSVK